MLLRISLVRLTRRTFFSARRCGEVNPKRTISPQRTSIMGARCYFKLFCSFFIAVFLRLNLCPSAAPLLNKSLERRRCRHADGVEMAYGDCYEMRVAGGLLAFGRVITCHGHRMSTDETLSWHRNIELTSRHRELWFCTDFHGSCKGNFHDEIGEADWTNAECMKRRSDRKTR
jgi:hypothetical protein